jgi:hypothetical protein
MNRRKSTGRGRTLDTDPSADKYGENQKTHREDAKNTKKMTIGNIEKDKGPGV